MLMAGVFATGALSATADNPAGITGLLEGNPKLLGIQIVGVLVTTMWCVVGTYIALKITSLFTELRVSSEDERQGLDLVLHGETLHQ